jgi:diketogulonate reductase-like aldo/keto reductase
MKVSSLELSNKTIIPQIGFGTWLIKDEEVCVQSVTTALEIGYRHIDTAQIYGNEQYVGQAIAESDIPRADLFITTKVWNENQFWDDVIPSLDESLERLQTDYVDLLLIHFPVTETRRPAWRRMETILESGKAKAIGVSNYTIAHLEELIKESKIKPAVNQVELHVFLQQPELVEYCRKHGIALEAYSPLAHGQGLQDAKLQELAKKHHKTVAQIMLRWCIEQGFIALPKSTHPERIRENFEIFDFKLDREDMEQLKKLNKDLRTCWDPTNIP